LLAPGKHLFSHGLANSAAASRQLASKGSREEERMPGVLNDPGIEGLLATLHARSEAQEAETAAYWKARQGPWRGMEPRDHAHYADKLVALDREKCALCYVLCRTICAHRAVEVGTSFGVSTLYLAAAIRDNGGGTVIGAEYESAKSNAARANFSAAGLSNFVDLRDGDLLDVLKTMEGPVDFVLFDIWAHVARPALDLILPKLRKGAVVCTDNTAGERSRRNYAELFEIIGDPVRFRTTTLPYEGGFEVSVKQ
jgi:predicted O-methyltransferase YrrM